MLFETSLFDKTNSKSYILYDPVKIIDTFKFDDVAGALELIEEYSKKHYLAGYLSYELGYYFERALFRLKDLSSRPLIHMCAFDKITEFDHRTGKLSSLPPGLFAKEPIERDFRAGNLKFDPGRREYLRKIAKIKEYIINGDTYQANFTGKYKFDFSGSPLSFYLDLRERQNVPYGAFCRYGDEYVISLSPELFFRRDGRIISSKPMKGTIARGRNIIEDRARVSELKEDAKEAAGNLMIVDLIRNDLGKISEAGSVKVSSLFEIEKYNTLFQMTSTVTSSLKDGVSYFEIFRSLFPGGSVTGAPKIRTMQILKELEKGDRGVYCGALGIIFPGEKAAFNLPIRTISIKNGKGEMGVGGGITSDSDPGEEYRECILKAKFLTERYRPFSLIETMLWDGKFKFLNEHLKRMRDSAEYFGFDFERAKILGCLKNTAKTFRKDKRYRIRLSMSKEGDLSVEASTIDKAAEEGAAPAIISRSRTDPADPFLYHKTTNRALYDTEHKRNRARGYLDVIFLNTKGEVAEGAISNVVIRKNGKYYTPPLSSGLLPGVFRGHLLKSGRAKEKILLLSDLRRADKIFLCNSVRGMLEVKVEV